MSTIASRCSAGSCPSTLLELRPRALVRLGGDDEVEPARIELGEQRIAPLRARQHGPALIHEDAREPGGEALTVLVVAERLEGAQERVLDRLFGVLAIAEDANGDPRAARIVAIDESRERLDVSLENLLDDDAITHG